MKIIEKYSANFELSHNHLYRDHDKNVIKIFAGDYYVTNSSKDVIMTILGSCIAACIRDPLLKIGGMNHFLLPKGDKKDDSTRYGAYAMEKLINELLKMGAVKSRLEVKLFGGGNVINNSALIGDKNINFILNFVKAESLQLKAHHLGGVSPRKIIFYPFEGKVKMKELKSISNKIMNEEAEYAKSLVMKENDSSNIELF